MLNWVAAAGVTLLFPILVEALGGPAWIFLMIGGVLLVGWGVNRELMVETKGRKEWEVREEYDRKWQEWKK